MGLAIKNNKVLMFSNLCQKQEYLTRFRIKEHSHVCTLTINVDKTSEIIS